MHSLHPEAEKRSCEICWKYEHYSNRNPDPKKRGKMIIEWGQKRLRKADDPPVCAGCLTAHKWAEKNAQLYHKWRFWQMGVDVGELEERDYWAFFDLAETEREINRAQMTPFVLG